MRARLPGALRQALVTELKELVQAGVKQIDLDLGGVKEMEFMDSTALGGFVALLTAVEYRGAKVSLVNLPRKLQEILEIANLSDRFK